eukprot:CAMPEP_0172558982 /NCGR_PEP_ID=MMETSP1067-20121228/81939_1 /TAXON_ID=265564 ORGANISM="Thalassiosira punctigera, Strain Tpunct2005C2" /NCGR_SAMPLE_ID=MMETSP1067 /ASSEMBLY_ACC=CAM_ASM_000444 /LENGTH=401 /DNA_ID=CAMNT_0013348471 /DNA_START=150 /DNA_END=1352 /DNA_ORIENTATION=+
MLLDKCNEACGYAAAISAAVCMGSFGVPVKSEVVSRLDVDPLVVQSYKTLMCFLTSWLIIPMGEPVRFTSWGIVSGLFWVPGGWAGIYGIRTAGLAVAAGTWSSMIVLTSFFWGIFVFEEHVKSKLGACGACGTLVVGLIGMSAFSRPSAKRRDVEEKRDEKGIQKKRESVTMGDEEDSDGVRKRIYSSQDLKAAVRNKGAITDLADISKRGSAKKIPSEKKVKTNIKIINGEGSAPQSLPLTALEMESLIEKEPLKNPTNPEMKRISVCGAQLTKRQLGIMGALFNGLWGGTNMIPLHYAAHEGYGGPSYVISFACGSMIITAACWVGRFLFELYRHDGDTVKAYRALPSFHLRQMWFLGGMSGILYSGGNFMCIISVTYLGQGVGYSFTQASMLISGLW